MRAFRTRHPQLCNFKSAIFLVLFFVLIVLMAVLCNQSMSCYTGGGAPSLHHRTAKHIEHMTVEEKMKITCIDQIDGVCRFPANVRNWRDNDYVLFEISPGPVSIYSSLMPWHIKSLNEVISKEVKKPPETIIDLTSHIGADSVNFMKLYPSAKITSVEIDQRIGGILKRNLTTFMTKLNIPEDHSRVIVDDARNIIKGDRYLGDIAFIDPPWLGSRDIPDLGGEPLEKYIKMMKNRTKLIFVKLPRESDYETFAKSVGMTYRVHPIHDARWGSKVSYWLVAFDGAH
jgi:hypothetical protein